MSPDGVLRVDLNLALHIAARFMLKGASVSDITRWGIDALPSLLKPMDDAAPPSPMAEAARDPGFAALLSRAIYAAMPLPARRFRPIKLELPERNDPCLCGSGRKFKQCCGPAAQTLPRFPPELCAGPMLDAMSKRERDLLPQQGMPVALVGTVADDWRHHGRAEDAAELLAPWLPKEGAIPDDLAELLDLLGDIYADLDKPRKRKALAQAMIDRGGRLVQVKGWQRMALMNCDAGKYDVARHAFQQAMRLDPADPDLSVLELSLLIGEGKTAQLRERADFWARHLARRNQRGEFDELIELVQDMGARGGTVLHERMLVSVPELKALADVLDGWPAPQLALHLDQDASDDDLGPLRPDAKVAAALREWHGAFSQAAPDLTFLNADDTRPLQNMPRWLPLLQRKVELGNSFDVLDELVRLLDSHPAPAGRDLADRYLQRALALWQQLIRRYPHAQCAWGFMDNRPALRLLARCITHDDTPDAQVSYDWLRHMVEVLNPHDNHGFRTRLMAVYLRRGMAAQALALSDRYPDDFCAMRMLRARALLALARHDEAMAAMGEVFQEQPHFAKVWASTRQPADSQDDFVRFGSVQEARAAYRDQYDLWQAPVLRGCIAAVAKASAR